MAADPDPEIARLDRTLAQLSEHYDSVQIIATRHNGEISKMVHRGTGNYFSRYGATVDWLGMQNARLRVNAEREAREDMEPEEGD